MEGFINTEPKIKKLKFPNGKIEVHLKDGRIITASLKYFPSIKKLTINQRKKWAILDEVGFDFKDSDEMFHIYQILGKLKKLE